MTWDLALIWAGLIAISVLIYVVLDGFDLGIGILFPFAKSEADKDLMMNSVAPVWDGNETWLVLGGGGLFAVFPLAYAIIMPALYIPITLMLLALVCRGVSFEYRWRTTHGKWIWDAAFFGGSFLAALCQGISLGALVQGIETHNRAYSGGWFDWLTPFSILTGVALVVGYALLGATWLILKTENELQRQMSRYAWKLGITILVMIGVISLLTPFQNPVYFDRWFNLPGTLWTMFVPLLLFIFGWLFFTGLNSGNDLQPFLATLGFFILSFVGLCISFFPMMVPPTLSLWDAAAPDESLSFALVGAVILLPIILLYTAYAYWVFKGKMDPSEGYHS
ncbi:MAG: cytochrome d ubiquinol oxidase subunit II [Gammaproteobacteria bacterium]|nr:cytochrome d ubiquinol oxidase subunit II [Gammaproteobacteria bacterium]